MNFDNYVVNFWTKIPEKPANDPKISTKLILFKKIFFKKCSGHLKLDFDNPVIRFGQKSDFFAQRPKIYKNIRFFQKSPSWLVERTFDKAIQMFARFYEIWCIHSLQSFFTFTFWFFKKIPEKILEKIPVDA